MQQTSSEKALDKLLAGSACPPVLLIAAADDIRKTRATQRICLHFAKHKDGKPSIERLEAKELSPDKLDRLSEDLSSLSLFAAQRYIAIERIEKMTAVPARKLAAILSQMPPAITIFLLADKPLSGGPLAEQVGAGAAIEFGELKGAALSAWVKQELKAGGAEAAPGVIDLLINVSQGSLDQIARMVEQLVLFRPDDKISEDDFYRLFVEVPDAKEYELLDAIERRNFAGAELLLQTLLNAGKSPMLIISSFYRAYAAYLGIVSMLKVGRRPDEIRETLGLKPWLFNKQLTASKAYTAEKLKAKLACILTADSKLKNRSLGAEAICSELIYQLAA